MARCFGSITARGHVTPATPSVLRAVIEYASAARVGAATHAGQLADDQRIRGRFDDRDHQSGEGIADRNEASRVCAIAATFDATRSRAPSENAIDLAQCLTADLLGGGRTRAALREHAQRATDTARIDERGSRSGRLLARAAAHAECTLSINEGRCLEPRHQRVEVTQRIRDAHRVAIDEVQPEALAYEDERALVRDCGRESSGRSDERGSGSHLRSESISRGFRVSKRPRKFQKAQLPEAQLREAHLRRAQLPRARLRTVTLTRLDWLRSTRE